MAPWLAVLLTKLLGCGVNREGWWCEVTSLLANHNMHILPTTEALLAVQCLGIAWVWSEPGPGLVV